MNNIKMYDESPFEKDASLVLASHNVDFMPNRYARKRHSPDNSFCKLQYQIWSKYVEYILDM
jgi:hypothetical protein